MQQKINKKCNIVTTCLPERDGITPKENLERAVKLLDSFKDMHPDLVCLPETFMEISVYTKVDYRELAGMCYPVLSQKARMLGSYLVAGVHDIIDDKVYNAAWLFDREGNLVGRYLKHYPVDCEMRDNGVVPGVGIPVFETDFGKLGILICFDIDFPDIWDTMGKKGAELVAWISAYEGGYPLNAYAAIHGYYVVSSARAYCSKIIDKSGRNLAVSSRWANWAQKTISLDKTFFHINEQYQKLLALQRDLGDKVTIETYDEEVRFTIESNDPDWPIERIIDTYQLVTFKDFHKQHEAMYKKYRD